MADVLADTVKSLRQSGVSNDEILDLLKSMGYTEEQINSALNSNGKVSTKIEPQDELDDFDDDADIEISKASPQDDKELLKLEADKAMLASSLAMSVSDAAVSKVSENNQKVDELKSDVSNLNNKLEQMPKFEHIESISKSASDIHTKTCDVDLKVQDLNVKVDVLMNLMKQILDSQRDILLKLK